MELSDAPSGQRDDERPGDGPSPAPADPSPFADLPTLDELERRYLRYALERCDGNRTRTAATLGIDRRTLYRMSARLGVPIARTSAPAREEDRVESGSDAGIE